MTILSIQSRVVAGHVGNSAAVPALQRMGHDVWAIDTVTYSNHPAHGGHTGQARPAAELRDLLRGLAAGGRLAACDGLLSGYLGSAENGAVVLDALARVRDVRPDAVLLCDPVMGDRGNVYVEPAIVDFFRTKAAGAADILTPNAFEASLLTGVRVESVDQALAAADILHRQGADAVVITGVAEGDDVTTLALDGAGAWTVTTPRIERPGFGAGDLFAALLLGHRLARLPLAECLERAVASVYAVMLRGKNDDTPDLPLVAALDMLAAPDVIFRARACNRMQNIKREY